MKKGQQRLVVQASLHMILMVRIYLRTRQVINRLSNWNTDRVRKKERLKIYNQYKSGDISYDEYVKQRKELEERWTFPGGAPATSI